MFHSVPVEERGGKEGGKKGGSERGIEMGRETGWGREKRGREAKAGEKRRVEESEWEGGGGSGGYEH